MFPIRDHNPSQTTPVVTIGLILINVVIFLFTLPLMDNPQALAGFYNTWSMVPADVTSGANYQGLLTSMFLHGGIMHIIGNMLFLWIFGDNMEDAFGHLGFLVFYLAAGIGADLAQVAAAPLSPIPTVGASGAIAGVLGGYLLLYPRARVDILFIFIVFFKVIPVPAWLMLGLWFVFQVLDGSTTNVAQGGVAYWAHAGGFVLGALFTLPVMIRRRAAGVIAPGATPARRDPNITDIPTVRRRR